MRVTSKGQVTIPRDLRVLAGIEPNSEVVIGLDGDTVTIVAKDRVRQVEDRQRLDRFLEALRRLEGTGDQAIDADELTRIMRDRD
ncbi:AbrB/MazE/SpoVT family DNA-binding domain-containing protein [Rhizobium sp. TRM95111]|uniref:AbrB/MazE/SpoVT family DNA-binding domain-containing protein n=1 Tax=Rhizobium alarense TaxID=2846851 RepID=UPI001F26886A|nr:AbrB/MazE/SpoVT family DNA-binding domain-containing protein [Rhizobium alarense]MCF3638418.1 AbrB/MazE/SpoVT family DNA-binding domain-containing protein [Rhizobium alarense]